MTFLDFCCNQAPALAAMNEATENEIFRDFLTRLALAGHYRLHLVKKFLRYYWFVPAFVYLAVIADQAAVERVFEKMLEVRYGHKRTPSTKQAKLVYCLSEQGEGVSAGGIQFERLFDKICLRRVNDDALVIFVIEIAERSHLRPQSVLQFLPYPSPDVLRKIIHIIFGLAERDLEHELSLRRILKPKS